MPFRLNIVPQDYVMPFRLNIVPQDFQRSMDKIFKEFKDFCVVYIDDILVFFQ